MVVCSSGGRVLVGGDLIGGYLGIDCAYLGLQEGDVCCLPAVVVVEKVIPLHELLWVHLDDRTVNRHLAHVHCSQDCRSKSFTTCRPNSLIL